MQTLDSNPTPENSLTSFSVGLRFGLILGVVSVFLFVLRAVLTSNPLDNDWTTTTLNILIGVGAVVMAHRYFKANGNGYMSYGKGLVIGLVVLTVSMVVSCIFMYVYLNFIDPSGYDAVWDQAREKMEDDGASAEAIEMGLSWAQKLFWPLIMVSGLFWGLVIGLIVSIFTQKPEPETAF